MRKFNFTVSTEKTKPPYLRLADGIRRAIRKGLLKSGEPLPSSRDLAESTGFHRHTVMAALEELVAEGWVTAAERKAYSVNVELPSQFFEAKKTSQKLKAAKKHEWSLARDISHYLPEPSDNPVQYNFRSGIPDLREFPVSEFRSHLNQSLRRKGAAILGYGSPFGHEGLIEELTKYLRKVRGLHAENLLITHGSQEAIFLCAQLLLAPGDSVAVESLGYPPAFAAFRAVGANLISIRIDEEGMDPASFEAAAKKGKLKLLYITPLHQYPTTVTLTVPRRMKIYEIAEKYGIPILEDDYDHEYHYRSQPLPPMASQDPAGLVIYISTFSKVFSPSARIGFMSVPSSLMKAISSYRRIVTRQNDLLAQDALNRWMKEGGFERHLRKTRRLYEERRNTLADCLDHGIENGLKLDYRLPEGGMAIWVNLHQDVSNLSERCLRAGIAVGTETLFNAKARSGTHLRLGFANQTPTEISSGILLMLKIARQVR